MSRHPRSIAGRRQFLRGAGYSLGLPFLPSLLPRRAHGQQVLPPAQRFFVAITSEHGAVQGPNFCPSDATLTQTAMAHPGHPVRFGPLMPTADGGQTRMSNVLRAPTSKLPASLVAKMNLLRGFDLGYYIGHHSGGHLGNFNRADQGPIDPATPTIDQVMAWSPSFYPNLNGVVQRSLVTGQDFRGISWNYANPAARSGGIQKVGVQRSSRALFDSMFRNFNASSLPPPRAPIVNRVIEGYRSLRQSNRRLSAEDRVRLDNHLTMLDELDRKLGTRTSGGRSGCDPSPVAGESTSFDRGNPRDADPQFFHLINDVIRAGFSCGLSRVASVCVLSTFMKYPGDWHQNIAHNGNVPANQQILVDSHQRTFEHVVVDLASKLDAVQIAPGKTLLDAALVQWTMEAGPSTHDMQWLPIVTFGSAGGHFRTGLYVDYRNRTRPVWGPNEYPGLLYRQWLANALLAMGVRPGEYQSPSPGYGSFKIDAAHRQRLVAGVVERAGDPLPVVTT